MRIGHFESDQLRRCSRFVSAELPTFRLVDLASISLLVSIACLSRRFIIFSSRSSILLSRPLVVSFVHLVPQAWLGFCREGKPKERWKNASGRGMTMRRGGMIGNRLQKEEGGHGERHLA